MYKYLFHDGNITMQTLRSIRILDRVGASATAVDLRKNLRFDSKVLQNCSDTESGIVPSTMWQ